MIAWPAILSNISTPLLGLADSAILGHLDSVDYLGAVAIGGVLLSFLYWGFSFLRMGTTGLVARATGAGDVTGSTFALYRSAILALGLALVVFTFHSWLLDAGFYLLSPQQELLPLAHSYASIRITSAPAVLVTYTIVGWFIGRQDTRWPMAIMVTTNGVNIGLDFLFIMGLGMTSDGAALATVIAEYLGCAIAIFAASRHLPKLPRAIIRGALLETGQYVKLLRANSHLFFRTVFLLFSFAFFTAMSDNFGSHVLAANTLLLQLLLMAAYGMDGFAFAAEALVGDRLGARALDDFFAAVKRCAFWCAITACLISAGLLVLQQPLVTLLTGIDSVKQLMVYYYPWVIVLPLFAAPSYLLDGVFIGSGETAHMMTTMVFCVLVVYLPLWYLAQGLGNHGLWLAFTAFNAARGLTLYYCFCKISRARTWLTQPV